MPSEPIDVADVDGDAASLSRSPLAERRFSTLGESWNARFFSSRLVIEGASGAVVELSVDEFLASAEVISTGLVVRKGKRRYFRLDEETRAVLRAWIEPFVAKQIARNLRRRVVFGAIWVGLVGIQNSFGVVTWSVYLALPAAIVVAIALRAPRREVYLAEAGLWALLCANLALVAFATRSWLWLVVAFFCAVAVREALKLFSFYAPSRTTLGKSFRDD